MSKAVKDRPKIERRDSHLRRERIIRAAIELYASEGLDVALDKIADRALVGRATLYRYFPDRNALTAATMQIIFDDLAAQMKQWGERDDAFFLFIRAVARLTISGHGFEKIVSIRRQNPEMADFSRQGFVDLVSKPLERAKAAGLVRADFKVSDVLLVSQMLAAGGLEERHGDVDTGIEHALDMLMPILAPPEKKRGAQRS